MWGDLDWIKCCRNFVFLQALPRKAELPLSSAVVTVYYCTLYHYADTEDKPGSLSVVQKV